MTLEDARKYLNRVREGHPMPLSLTTQALLITGDISPSIPCRTLCVNGNEQSNDRAIKAESKGTEGRFSYSGYLDSAKIEGISQ